MTEGASYAYAKGLTDEAVATVSGYKNSEMLVSFAEYLYGRSV
jgi:hypothetical protein